jgi:hypothetical protein
LGEYPGLENGAPHSFDLPLGPLTERIYDSIGREIKGIADREVTGRLAVNVRVPPVYSNMCGWFYDIQTDFFKNVSGIKRWMVLKNDAITCYDSQFQTNVVEVYSCKEIVCLEEKKCELTEIQMDGVEILFNNGRRLYWAWGNLSYFY